jgi:hypothetical protein
MIIYNKTDSDLEFILIQKQFSQEKLEKEEDKCLIKVIS